MLLRRSFIKSLLSTPVLPVRAAAPSRPAPRVQRVGSTDATVVWNAQELDGTALLYSAGGNSWQTAKLNISRWPAADESSNGFRFRFRADLSGLPPGAAIRYCLAPNGVPDGVEEYRFRTMPAASGSLRVVAFGDSGSAGEPQSILAARMLADQPDLAVHTGDTAYPLADFPTLAEHYLEPLSALLATVPLYPCPGNHDAAAMAGECLLWLHDLPEDPALPPRLAKRNYRWCCGPAEFFAIDTNESLWQHSALLLDWLDRALRESAAYWRIVVLHHTPWPAGRHAADPTCAMVRELLVPQIERHGVPLVLCGHQHSYQRTAPPPAGDQGALWVTTGGGGGGLYDDPFSPPNVFGRIAHHYVRLDLEGCRLRLQAVGCEGEVFDEVVLRPSPHLESVAIDRDGGVRLIGRHLAPPGPEAAELRVTCGGEKVPLIGASPCELRLAGGVRAGPVRIDTPNGSVEWRGMPPSCVTL